MRRTRARHFGDNPRIRRRYGEGRRLNAKEPWERHYRGIKKRYARVRGHHVRGRGFRRGHIRKLR